MPHSHPRHPTGPHVSTQHYRYQRPLPHGDTGKCHGCSGPRHTEDAHASLPPASIHIDTPICQPAQAQTCTRACTCTPTCTHTHTPHCFKPNVTLPPQHTQNKNHDPGNATLIRQRTWGKTARSSWRRISKKEAFLASRPQGPQPPSSASNGSAKCSPRAAIRLPRRFSQLLQVKGTSSSSWVVCLAPPSLQWNQREAVGSGCGVCSQNYSSAPPLKGNHRPHTPRSSKPLPDSQILGLGKRWVAVLWLTFFLSAVEAAALDMVDNM